MKKITLLVFILYTLVIPFNTYGFNSNSISINIRGSNSSFRYSQHNYQTIQHRPVIRHYRHHRGGYARGYARHGGYRQGYHQGYRDGYRDGYRSGYYDNYRPVIIYSTGNAYWERHSPAAYRREIYVSERAYRHGREW